MRRRWIGIALLAASPFLMTHLAFPQEMVTEPSTGKQFPAVQTFSAGGKEYTLQLTGVAVRKKVIFKVYGMAHHMESPAGGTRAGARRPIATDLRKTQQSRNCRRFRD
jgi:hypothetical protein